ncbi:hypothetical protein SANTM175S_09216 [Streptomyces antimycoticus]
MVEMVRKSGLDTAIRRRSHRGGLLGRCMIRGRSCWTWPWRSAPSTIRSSTKRAASSGRATVGSSGSFRPRQVGRDALSRIGHGDHGDLDLLGRLLEEPLRHRGHQLFHPDLLSSPGLDEVTRASLEADFRRQFTQGTRQAAHGPFGSGVVPTEFARLRAGGHRRALHTCHG